MMMYLYIISMLYVHPRKILFNVSYKIKYSIEKNFILLLNYMEKFSYGNSADEW